MSPAEGLDPRQIGLQSRPRRPRGSLGAGRSLRPRSSSGSLRPRRPHRACRTGRARRTRTPRWADTARTSLRLDAFDDLEQGLCTRQQRSAGLVVDANDVIRPISRIGRWSLNQIAHVPQRDGSEHQAVRSVARGAAVEAVPLDLITGLGGWRRDRRRVHHYVEVVRLEDSIWRTARVLAPALVVQNRYFLVRALVVTDADLERMRRGVVLLLQRGDRRHLGEVDALARDDEDVVSATVNRGPGLYAHVAVATGGILVLRHLESAHDPPAVQPLVMVAEFVDVIALLVAEVAFDQQLPGEVMIACERPEIAGGTLELAHGFRHGGHAASPVLPSVTPIAWWSRPARAIRSAERAGRGRQPPRHPGLPRAPSFPPASWCRALRRRDSAQPPRRGRSSTAPRRGNVARHIGCSDVCGPDSRRAASSPAPCVADPSVRPLLGQTP